MNLNLDADTEGEWEGGEDEEEGEKRKEKGAAAGSFWISLKRKMCQNLQEYKMAKIQKYENTTTKNTQKMKSKDEAEKEKI